MHSLGTEGLVGDIGKDLGHINSYVNLPRADKVLCMMNVGRRKLGRTTTKRLRKMRTMFRVKPRDCANAMASRSCNIASCMANIKQRKDVVLDGR
jgi:hypothetical protein